MSAIPVANPGASYRVHKAEIDAAVLSVLESGWYIAGDEVAQFETEFASYCGAEHCVSTGTGTDGLILSLRALGVGPGDVVVTGAGAAMWGYHSELERTMIIGDPSPEQQRFFAHMKAAQ